MYDEITEIEDYAISRNGNLIALRMSSALENAWYGSFSSNIRLLSIVFPDAFEQAGTSLVQGCQSLETVNLGSVLDIPYAAATSCYNLDRIITSELIETIGYSAFALTQLKNIHIQETVTSIGAAAFSNVKPETVTIDSEAVANALDSINSCGSLIQNAYVVKLKNGLTINRALWGYFNYHGLTDGYHIFISKTKDV